MDTLIQTPILFNGKPVNPDTFLDMEIAPVLDVLPAATILQYTIINRLLNDSPYISQFPGGVWDRTPKAGTGMTATPGAFYTTAENPKEANLLKPSIAVIDGGDVPAPNGEARYGFQGFPLVYGYVPATTTGRSLLGTLEGRLRFLFQRGVSYAMPDGSGLELLVLERQPIRDGEEFGYPGRIFTIWRVQGTFLRSPV